MFQVRCALLLTLYFGIAARSISGQTFVYSGREYFQQGRSWAQIRLMDVAAGKKTQLTTSSRDHWRPWCSPDDKFILFAAGAFDKTLYRFDRATKRETPAIMLENDFYAVVADLGNSRILVQEYGAKIEIVDLFASKSIRLIDGFNPVLSSDKTLLAWQTAVDLFSKARSHIRWLPLSENTPLDVGEGMAPVFSSRTELLFLRERDDMSVEIVRYDTKTRMEQVRSVRPFEYGSASDSTLSPNGTLIVSTGGGRNNTAVYWRLTAAGDWAAVDDNLHEWGGWSPDGQLVYATDGRDLRSLDSKRSVWVGDIKLLDQGTGEVRTVVSGVSMNQNPTWCSTSRELR